MLRLSAMYIFQIEVDSLERIFEQEVQRENAAPYLSQPSLYGWRFRASLR
jgi:hypothetical protein